MPHRSPIGATVIEGARRRARRSGEYRAEQARVAPYEELARAIIRLRIDKGLTQEALAELVGTSKPAISRLESGQHAPTVHTLQKIARAFGGHLLIGLEVPSGGKASSQTSVLARVG